MNEIHQLSLDEKHITEIHGLGEIYHIISAEQLRRRLLKKFSSGMLFLSSNSSHGGSGFNRESLEEEVRNRGYKVLTSGFVDSPPWRCQPRSDRSPLLRFAPLAKLLFPFLVKLEPFREGEKKSHMIFVLASKTKRIKD